MRKFLLLIILLINIFQSHAQNFQVSGTVKSATDNSTIPGVNIVIIGTDRGTVTDFNGSYTIEAQPDSKLQFSSMGFVKKVIDVNGRENIDVILDEDLKQIDEVVVIGYGTQKKEDLTTSLISVGSEDLSKISSASFSTALQGKAAGVIVNSESGQPGGNNSIRIRGYGALNNNEPLYVVDGVIINSYSGDNNPTRVGATPANSILATLNPNDIESINILKDASATAIYGSRAGNGVVLITTKTGEQGKAKINFNSYYGVQAITKKISLMSGKEFAGFSNEARRAAGMVPYNGYSNLDTLKNTDWQDELFEAAPIQNYQLSASGGNQNSDYYLSFGYFDQQGVIPNSYYKRYSLRLNSNHKITERIKVGNTLTLSHSTSNSLPNGNLHSGVVLGALRMPGYIPVSGEINGVKTYFGIGDYESLFAGRTTNPVYKAQRSYNLNLIKKALGNVYVDIEIIKNLIFKTNLTFDYTGSVGRTFEKTFEESPYINPNENPISFRQVPSASSSVYLETNIGLDNTLTFNKTFGKYSVNAMVGHTAQEFKIDNTYTTSSGHLTNALITTAAGDPTTQIGSNSLSELAYESYIARVQNNYDSKYYLSYSYRRDGSSRFGSGLKFASFHSVSGAWRVSGEKFMEETTNVISDLKLRGSWGQTGIDGSLQPVEYPKVQNHFSYVFNGNQLVTGYAPVGLPNPKLKWETAEQIDIGLDLRLLDGKIDFVADYFYKKQFDIITEKPVPFLLGITDETYSPRFPVAIVNGPEVINKGYELSLNYNSSGTDLYYNIGLNFTSFDNEIIKLENDILSNSYNGYNVVLNREGFPINQFYGFQTDGIITSTDDEALSRQPGSALGDIRYLNIDGNDIIDDNDRTIIGSPIPDFTFGLNLSAEYKNFDISAAFQGVYGNEIYNANLGWILNSKDGSNRHAFMNDRWSEENPEGKYQRAIATDPNNNARASDLFIEDGSYLRFQNLEIGYSFSPGIIEKINSSSFRIYISSQNLFTLSNYSGYSPEVGAEGIDASVYPLSRSVLIGLNVVF